jgi:hypothetical protein
MVTCNSIGYFSLVLSALLPLVLCDLLHVWILYLSARPSLPALLLCQNSGLSFSSNPPSRYHYSLL